jgi:hypothetical protein
LNLINSTIYGGYVNITALNLSLDVLSSINTGALGYAGGVGGSTTGLGPCGGIPYSSSYGGGGCHGGNGGINYMGGGGGITIYGSPLYPQTFGSGGAGGGTGGGAGGGINGLSVADTFKLT